MCNGIYCNNNDRLTCWVTCWKRGFIIFAIITNNFVAACSCVQLRNTKLHCSVCWIVPRSCPLSTPFSVGLTLSHTHTYQLLTLATIHLTAHYFSVALSTIDCIPSDVHRLLFALSPLGRGSFRINHFLRQNSQAARNITCDIYACSWLTCSWCSGPLEVTRSPPGDVITAGLRNPQGP
jgi:hypothetical protein